MPDPSSPIPIARLVLEDGAVFTGHAFGACTQPHTTTGEVVFNTAMTGYQEALSDPSYAGQILTMTATQIGNYGVTPEDLESARPHVAGFVIRELARRPSNHRATGDLHSWLAQAGVLGICRIDTRALVRRIRHHGAMRGVLSCDASLTTRDLQDRALNSSTMSGQNLAAGVSGAGQGDWADGLDHWRPHDRPASPTKRFRVLALDCGAKRNIYRHLTERGCIVEVLGHDVGPDQVRRRRPDGLIVSNGPGDPSAVRETIETLAAVAGEVPTLGICLGHQLLALAMGAQTFKLKFGHRGANHPVRNIETGRIEITSQNHGFCVDPDSLAASDCQITHIHLNDGTLAGFRHRTKPIFSVQYHPEASPGPHDSGYLFDAFIQMMATGQPPAVEQMAGGQAQGGPLV